MADREWTTETRGPWCDLIRECLRAIDRHQQLYIETSNSWHAAKAQDLRWYVAELKEWITRQER